MESSAPTSTSVAEETRSFWIATAPQVTFPLLTETVSVDVAILGGGIVGILTAWLLKQAGATVAVIEANRICHGVTGHTTAKVTALHGLIYEHLTGYFGKEMASIYAHANSTAIERIADWTRDGLIACDLRRAPAYTYTTTSSRIWRIEAEVKAAQAAGLPAEFVDGKELPMQAEAAIRLDNQLHFHPLKFLLHIAPAIPGDGSHVFEQTRALSVRQDRRPMEVLTDRGVVHARNVVVATHYPILNKPGLYFSRLYPIRSYVVGLEADGALQGMYYQYEHPGHSYRPQPFEGETLAITGGEDQRTGTADDTVARYERVAEWGRSLTGSGAARYRWSTQDNATPDRVPYIGRLTGDSEGVFVATGFDGWGMTHGVISAMTLTDLIVDRDNAWARLYDSTRFRPATSARQFLVENVKTARHLIGDRVEKQPTLTAANLDKGQGSLITAPDGSRAAIYKDEEGIVHAVNPTCTHMGCLVHWNQAERSWDCPCHGSRFGPDGEVLHAPAIRPLGARNLSGE